MSLYRRGGVWWVYIVHDGKRFRRSTGEREKQSAQRIHDELKADLWKSRDRRTLHGALNAWVQGKGESDRYQVAKLKRLVPDQPIAGLDLKSLAAALPQKPGTFNRYANAISAAGIKGLPRKKNPPGRTRWLTAEEWEALRKHLPEWQVPMADFALATGLRQDNVFWLEWAQVDLARKKAWIHGDQSKNDEPLGVRLSDAAVAVLERQRGKSEVWVFPGRDGNPVTKIKQGWKTALKAAGIPHCRWHDLRHTWATWHIMGGTPLEVLQRLGGWKDQRMVLRYAHLAESYLDRYADNAKPYSHNPGHSEALSA